MRKSAPSFAPVFKTGTPDNDIPGAPWPWWLVCFLGRAVGFVAPENRFGKFPWIGGGVAVLVIFRNFTADVTHPDNLVMLHTAGVFWLALWAWREKRFGVAVLAMLFAGWGVFAKQILA